MELKVEISGIKAVSDAVRHIMNDVTISDKSADFNEGFHFFGSTLLQALEKMQKESEVQE